MITLQDEAVLRWLAQETCDYHQGDHLGFVDQCGYCEKAYRTCVDAFDYGKSGRLPLRLADAVMGRCNS